MTSWCVRFRLKAELRETERELSRTNDRFQLLQVNDSPGNQHAVRTLENASAAPLIQVSAVTVPIRALLRAGGPSEQHQREGESRGGAADVAERLL